MPVWDAEVAIDGELVRALLADQFPELDASSARLLGEGWDNSVWVIEEEWAFRFPRRAIAIPGVERELAVLPRLSQLLPAPTPVPVFLGETSERFPWPFFGARLLPGHEAADACLTEEARVELGAALGRFLCVLHAPESRAAVDPDDALPVDPNRRTDMPARVQIAREWLVELQGLGAWSLSGSVERLFDSALGLPPAGADAIVHGDLHVRHVLVAGTELSGVIDWGDICRADPAVDLMLAHSLLPRVARDAFISEYGPVDEERTLRARVLAVSLCAALAVYGRREGHANLEHECLAGLERALIATG